MSPKTVDSHFTALSLNTREISVPVFGTLKILLGLPQSPLGRREKEELTQARS
jgi:hypothetical protein